MSSLSVIPLNTTMTTTNSSSIIITILIGICLSFIALITALGNMIVLLAFYCDKKLRTINDYFILNMAIADFLVGFICIPFYIPFSITQSWPFGRFFCKIWVTIDDVTTMASVINIVAISINRYWSIAYPLSYRKYVKQHFVYLVMTGVWCLSFINFAPGIWLLSLFNEENLTRSDCSGDYNNSFIYMLIAQFNYFIWPFIVLCVLNLLLMLNIWKRSRKMIRLTTFNQSLPLKEENLPSSPLRSSKDSGVDEQRLSKPVERCPSIIPEESENIIANPNISSSNKSQPKMPIFLRKNSSTMKYCSRIRYSNKSESRDSSPMIYLNHRSSNVNNYRNDSIDSEMEISRPILHSRNKRQHIRKGQSRIIRDRKAARSLFILVIVFLLFLFPYVICATASTAGVNISAMVFEISFWLLWLNSTCNPFLYPFIQIKYRRAYVKLFQSCLKFFSFSRSNRPFNV